MKRAQQILLLLTLGWTALAAVDPPGPWNAPPALPPPTGTVVTVTAGNVADLISKVGNATSHTTVRVPAGNYLLTSPLQIGWSGQVQDVRLQGMTGNRNDVIIRGPGMSVDSSGTVPHCLMIGNAQDITVADLTLGDVWYHPITIAGEMGASQVLIHNCRLYDAGEQFVKGTITDPVTAPGVSDSTVEYCVFEYTTTARSSYTEGIDVHAGHRWLVRGNLFRNIRGPVGASGVGGAIDFWNTSADNVVEGNTIIDCSVGIRFGIINRSPAGTDNAGGIIRNNTIVRHPGAVWFNDVGIYVSDSPNTQVLHNTVLLEGTYPNAIEIRFARSAGVQVRNNLCDGATVLRDGATATLSGNLANAATGWFVNQTIGDLHLLVGATAAIDQVAVLANCPTDQDSQARPIGVMADIGADEYGSGSSNQPPTVSAATATPSPVTVTTTALAATATDDAGEPALTYTWSASPATVTFSPNGSNAARASTATFSAAGTYTLTVTARDAGSLTATRTVSVTVNKTPTTTTVSPATVSVAVGASTTLTAVVQDQFATTIASPAITWSVVAGGAGGTVTSGGVYTAPATAGTDTVRATSGAAVGNATVTITAPDTTPPVITTPAAGPANVGGTTAAVTVAASDNNGSAGLTYTWAVNSGPGGSAISPNASNAADSATVTFAYAGAYTLTATVRDGSGNATPSGPITITVGQTATVLVITPASPSVASGGSASLAATVTDQFGDAITAAVPTWLVEAGGAGGTVTGAGVFTAPVVAANASTVLRATSGALTRTVSVAITTSAGGSAGGGGGGAGSGGCGGGGLAGLLCGLSLLLSLRRKGSS